ncbi:MAG: fumarylacetoacetate hydrolase family protein [Nocardioides sp.]
MKIARFVLPGSDPGFGVIQGELDQFGQLDDEASIAQITGDPLYAGIQPTGEVYRFSEVKLLAPVIPRSKVVGIGKNYAAHAEEMKHLTGSADPEAPLTFLKPNTSVIGPGDAIVIPEDLDEIDFEGELAVVIGRICKDVPPEQATDVIFGYTIANDVTSRLWQTADGQWSRAKGSDTFCPIGPWIETDLDPADFSAGRTVQTWLNGDLRQDGSTADLIHDVSSLVAWVSRFMTLLPGDVILTGTPAGVGAMHDGDEVEIAIEGLGALTNRVVAKVTK